MGQRRHNGEKKEWKGHSYRKWDDERTIRDFRRLDIERIDKQDDQVLDEDFKELD